MILARVNAEVTTYRTPGARPAAGRLSTDTQPGQAYQLSRAQCASTTQTGPVANVIGWPDSVVKVVPPLASGRDQRAW
jgi:hypothetical protein